MNNKELIVMSLFSGAGGDTLGLENAGFFVKYFSENNKKAISTHLLNFPKSTLIEFEDEIDITKIPNIYWEQFVGKIDLIFAGFPCQGFSHAGKKDPNDERNKLFYNICNSYKYYKTKMNNWRKCKRTCW